MRKFGLARDAAALRAAGASHAPVFMDK